MELYFTYGSNLASRQMRVRCPQAKFVSRAILLDHEPKFCLVREFWQGGVLSACPAKGKRVEGVIYEVSPEALSALDVFQGTDVGESERVSIEVETENKNSLLVWTYIFQSPMPGVEFTPSRKYLDRLIEGGLERELSEDYLKKFFALRDEIPEQF